MEKRIIFIGSNFRELIFKNSILKMSFIEILWSNFKTINSEVKFNAFIKQLKKIEDENAYFRNNDEFLTLVKHIKTDYDYNSILDLNERLTLFKKILCKSMNHQFEQVDEQTRNLLGNYLANHDYIFSYDFDFLIENLIQAKSDVTVCTDRQSFLLSENNLDFPVLYKFYGSFDRVETIALTREEKQERMINVRMGISKITQLEDISISLMGFNEEDAELTTILDELVLKNNKVKISLLKLCSHEQEVKSDSIKHKTGLEIDVIISNLHTYLNEGLKEKDTNSQIKQSSVTQFNEQEELSSTQMSRSRSKKRKKKIISDKNISLKIPYKTLFISTGMLFFTLIFNFFFSVATIKGESMTPSFSSSDYVVLNKQYNKVERFDVVAFQSPDEAGQEYIKRVIGLPGDMIEYIEDQLYINGNPVEETYLDREKEKLGEGEIFTKDFSLQDLSGVKEVPKNKLFVLGDNRLYSRDSRNFGFIDVNGVKGNVQWKIWSGK
ncbi:Signal peptidase I (modular protein) [Carnobacterium maltaromaticum]|uniref:signal peptidase I n=1 Tax=Carnobacterium maltaromaticum TaxID=2751 RepID=UPI00191BB22F|nr:signal peptidase I [Carnobacterium maltaromaticum]CAD5899520.1 Signal peptidase I (modular protein) [Carnobacterium maltaromaticum]